MQVQKANQFFNIHGSEDGPRAAKTHGGVVSQRTKTVETQENKKQGKQQLAAQEQFVQPIGSSDGVVSSS